MERAIMFQKINLFLIVMITALLSACSEVTTTTEHLPYYNDADFTPIWVHNDVKLRNSMHEIPSFSLTNQNGETITEATFQNKIYVADFFFTACPGICPKMTKNMQVVQNAFKKDKDVLLISHSVTPENDSVEVLREYADEYQAIDQKWHFVTGTRKGVYELARKGYFADETLGLQKDENDFLHTENFILIDRNRKIRGVYKGTNPVEVERLIEDILILKKED
jgi:protein SCO1/2